MSLYDFADDDIESILRQTETPTPRQEFVPERREPFDIGPVSISGDSIDALLEGLAESSRGMKPGFARGLVRGATRSGLRGIEERDRRNTMGRQRADDDYRNRESDRRSLRDSALRMVTQRNAKRSEDSEQVPVPAWMAQAMGRDDLLGKSVSGAEWKRIREQFDDRLQLRTAERLGREKPVPELSPKERLQLEQKERRANDMRSKLEMWRQKRVDAESDMRKRKTIPSIDANIARIEADLERLESGGAPAGGPGTVAPAPAAAPVIPQGEPAGKAAGRPEGQRAYMARKIVEAKASGKSMYDFALELEKNRAQLQQAGIDVDDAYDQLNREWGKAGAKPKAAAKPVAPARAPVKVQ